MRAAEHWNRFPGAFVVSPSLEIFRTQLEMALSNLLLLSLF